MIDRINTRIGRMMAYSVLIILGFIVYEVFTRRVFSAPTIWTYEMCSFLFGGYIMLILPYALLLNVNVSVDVLYNRFSPKTQRILDIITFVLFFIPFMVVFLIAGYKFAYLSWVQQEKTWSLWAPLLYPVKLTIPIGTALTLLQGISELIKKIARVSGKQEWLALIGEGAAKKEVV